MKTLRYSEGCRCFLDENGNSIGWWYGLAWRDYEKKEAYYATMPFNWFYRWGKSLYWKIRFPRNSFEELWLDECTKNRKLRYELRMLER